MRSGHSRVPVYDDVIDKIIGVFYAKDILKAVNEDRLTSFQMRDFLRPVTFVPEQMRISDLLRQFQKSRIHIAVVVDEFGGTSGLITLEDVIEVFFGDIQDEYDVEEDYFQEIEPGVLRASAKTPVSLITEHFNVEIPEEEEGDYDSLGGFVVAQIGSLPPVGTELIYEGLRFQVTKADARRVIEVLVCRCAPTQPLPSDKTEADRAAS
jgi:magnesium and cobalt transporter